MNTKLIAGGALSGLALAGGFAAMVSAQSAAEATNLTEAQIIEIALIEVPGEVLEVELEGRGANQTYEVEILAEDGSEFEVEIAAASGEVLEVEADDKDCDHHDDDDDDESEDA